MHRFINFILLGQLAGFRWRSKFGRPSKVPELGDVDPTGSYCPLPEEWLLKKYGIYLFNIYNINIIKLFIANSSF